MQTLSLTQPIPAASTTSRLSRRVVAGALRGNALAALPDEAFEEDVVVQRFFGRQHILLQRPEAIRHVLIDNPQNYRRSPAATRVLRPMFGRGLFLSAGEDWRQQRRSAVIDEVLRLYPPAFVIVRQSVGDDNAGGVRVPKGSLVLIAPWVPHRNRRFCIAPGRFDPARFLPDRLPPPRFAYMPFGAGPRICVGNPFALTELVLVAATMFRSFRTGLRRTGR